MPSAGGILELIGVRAVIVDFRQYMNQGRQLEAATAAIGRETANVEKASLKTAAAQQALQNVENARIQGNARLAASIQSVVAAQQKLAASQAVAASPRPRDPSTGRYISQAQAQAAVTSNTAVLAAAKAEQTAAQASIPTITAQTAARKAAAVSADAEAVATSRLAGVEEKEAAIGSQRAALLRSTAAVAGAALTVGIGVAAVNSAAKYQTTLARISTLTNTSRADTEKLGKSFIDLSKEVPTSPDELGAAAYFVLSSGVKDANKALEITKISAKDAAIGLGSTQDVAKVLTSIIVAYGEENITASQASDILVQAVKEGRAEASDFAGALGKVLPIASAIGVTFNEVAAAEAVLTNGGLSADEAATGLRAILNDLTKSSPQAEKALASVGYSANQLRQDIQEKGLAKTMLNLIQLFKGNVAAIEPIIPNIRGLVAASSAFISQGGTVEGVLNNINNAGGATDKAFAQMSKTFAFQAGLLRNSVSRAFIEIGSAILPSVTTAVTDLTEWIGKNHDAIQALVTQGLGTFIQVLKDVAAGINLVIQVLGYIPANAATIAAAVITIGAAFAWALPGSPYVKGLLLVLTLLGQIQKGVDLPVIGNIGGDTEHAIGTALGGLIGFGGGFAAGGPLGGLAGGAGGSIAGNKIADLIFGKVEKKAQDTKKAIDPVDDALSKFSKITLPNLERNTSGVEKEDKKLAAELKKLASEFVSTSDAAADAESFTKKLKLFGEIGPDLAHAFDLNATAAGAVQAADAIVRGLDNVDNAEFQYVKTLATVANLIAQGAEDLARETVLGLARGALAASQKAEGAIFSGPTREVANLNVPLSQSRLHSAQIAQRIDPQLYQLNKLNDSIDKQLKSIDKSERDEEKRRKVRDDALKTAFDKQTNVLEDQLDALKYANLLAKNAYEVQAAKLQDLIDANKKSISDLQANFLKSNENLQQQINQAIGAGNTQQALGLVAQQQAATRSFRNQNTGLNNQGQALTSQQIAAEKAEKVRERTVQLAEAQLEKADKALKKQQENIEALNKQNDALRDNKQALENTKDSLEGQKEKIDDQIKSLTSQKGAQDEATKVIQDQIAVYQAQSDVLKAQIDAANHTLLTQEEQAKLADILKRQIDLESQAIRDLTNVTGDLVPEVKDANVQFGILKDAVRVLVDESFRNTLVAEGIDPAAKRLAILAAAAGDATGGVKTLGSSTSRAVDRINEALTRANNFSDTLSQHLSTGQTHFNRITPPNVGDAGIRGYALGGFTGREGGYVHPHEMVLPLNNLSRAREVFGQLPAGFVASLRRGRSGPRSIFGDLNVQGYTLEDMRATAHREVDSAFNRAGSTSRRSGSLLSSGVGGSDY